MSSKTKQAVFFTEDIREMLECPVCLRVPRKPPIYQCDRGHLLCSECHPKLANCPVCRIHLGQTRSLISEKVLDRVPIACGFQRFGCKIEDVRTAIDEHEQDCPYRVVCCADLACNEEVCMANLLEHISKEHTKGDFVHTNLNPYKSHFIVNKEDFGREIFWMTDHVTFDGHHFFRQCLRNSSSIWYTWVCMLGSKKDCENYSYTVKIYSTDKTRELSFRGKCLPLDTKRDTSNKIGHCLTFTDQIAKTFWACPRLYYFFQLHAKNPSSSKPASSSTTSSSSDLKRTTTAYELLTENGLNKPQTSTSNSTKANNNNTTNANAAIVSEETLTTVDHVVGDMSNMAVSNGQPPTIDNSSAVAGGAQAPSSLLDVSDAILGGETEDDENNDENDEENDESATEESNKADDGGSSDPEHKESAC